MNSTQYDYRKPSTFETLQRDIQNLKQINNLEKAHVTSTLQRNLSSLIDSNNQFILSDWIIAFTHDSSLQIAHRAGQSMLKDLLASEEFLGLEELSSLSGATTYVCDANMNMHVLIDDEKMHVDDLLKENEVLHERLKQLSNYASSAGDFIYSSDEFNVEQWLRFYGYPIPSTARQLVNLIEFFNKERPKLPTAIAYYRILKDPEFFPTALPLIERRKIEKVTKSFGATKKGQLLKTLVEQVISLPTDILRAAPNQYISNLLESTIGKIWARGYLDALNWYGATSGASPSTKDLEQLLITAIILNLEPEAGLTQNKGRALGYGFYNPVNAEVHPAKVLLMFEKHLVDNNIVDATVVPLAAYLLACAAAPELVVKQIPDDMTINSPAWVVHSVAVEKIEHIAPGASAAMTFDEVQAYADLEPFDDNLEQLFGLNALTSMLNWGAMNRLIPYSERGEYNSDDYRAAEALYTDYTEALEQCRNAINTPLRTRHEMALNELKRAMPDGDYLTNRNYMHTDLPLGETISAHELFMSGDLMNEGWTGLTLSHKIMSTFEAYELPRTLPYLGRLQDIKKIYTDTFNHYFDQLRLGTATALKLAMSKMPEADRKRLEYGNLSFFTVRKQFHVGAAKETQRDRDKYRGRFGVIISSEYNSRFYYYELFTLRAECHRRQDLHAMFGSTNLHFTEASVWHDKDEKQWQAQGLDWPLDIDAYLKGTPPIKNISNKVVVEKLWQAYEQEGVERVAPQNRSQVEMFFSEATSDTVNRVLEYFPPATYDELYNAGYGIAPLEAARQNTKDRIDLVLNLIIPFKSCIEDLSSGDRDRERGAIFGCALDALSIVGAVLGVAPKFASIAFKSGSLLSRSLTLARVSSSFALSLVNPLDGVPSLLKKGATITKNGVVLVTGVGSKVSGKAVKQLQSLSGALDTYTAARSLNCIDMKLARVEGISELSQSVDVLLFKRANDWFELDLNSCKVRGGKVTDYKEIIQAGEFERV
ncbi:hypothetical protein D3C71_959650 [compost metagenome]